MRKKLLTILVSLTMIVTLAGCDSNTDVVHKGSNSSIEGIDISQIVPTEDINSSILNEQEIKEAISILSAYIEDGDLIFTMSDGSQINVGRVQGEKGEKGEQGEQGAQGIRGEQGEQGAQGIKGEQGEQGVQGIKGDKGAQGSKGDAGDKGEKGDKGENGSDGSTTTNLTIDNFQSGVVTDSVSSSSTDSQLPTAKSVYDGINSKLDNNLGSDNAGKYLKVNSDGSVITDNVSSIDIVDDLSTDDSTKALSAKQGKVLNETKANISDTYSKEEVDELFESFFDVMYPVGSQYTSYSSDFNPNSADGWSGTWEKIEEGYFVEATEDSASVGTTKAAGLPNIEGYLEVQRSKWQGTIIDAVNGSFTTNNVGGSSTAKVTNGDDDPWLNRQRIGFSANLSNPIYGNSTTVQPKSILAYIWKRVG